MNWKLTKWKVVVSVVLSALVILISSIIVSQNCMPKIGGSCPVFSYETFIYLLVYFILPLIIIIYIIWSLIQKSVVNKKKVKKK